MTPFAETVRELRRRKGVTQKEMALAIGVSPAYLSALEHGRRGKPSFDLIQRIAGYFNIIWDEAEDLLLIAETSNPRVVVDTIGLPPAHTQLANTLARKIRALPLNKVELIQEMLDGSDTPEI